MVLKFISNSIRTPLYCTDTVFDCTIINISHDVITIGVELIQYDEFHSLVMGIHFILDNVSGEIFYWDKPNFSDTPEKKHLPIGSDSVYPYLVVNIGSGVSIILVRSQKDIERVGGTSVGGGTFLGLTSLLTGVTSFDDAIALAERGDHTKVR